MYWFLLGLLLRAGCCQPLLNINSERVLCRKAGLELLQHRVEELQVFKVLFAWFAWRWSLCRRSSSFGCRRLRIGGGWRLLPDAVSFPHNLGLLATACSGSRPRRFIVPKRWWRSWPGIVAVCTPEVPPQVVSLTTVSAAPRFLKPRLRWCSSLASCSGHGWNARRKHDQKVRW